MSHNVHFSLHFYAQGYLKIFLLHCSFRIFLIEKIWVIWSWRNKGPITKRTNYCLLFLRRCVSLIDTHSMGLYSQHKTSGNFHSSEVREQLSCKHTAKSLKAPAGGSNWKSFQRSVLFFTDKVTAHNYKEVPVGGYAADLAP